MKQYTFASYVDESRIPLGPTCLALDPYFCPKNAAGQYVTNNLTPAPLKGFATYVDQNGRPYNV